MAATRSRKTSDSNMSVSKEIQLYFESLIKPLATNEGMHKLLENFVHDITQKFKEKFKVLGQKIEDQNSMIDKLEAKVAIQDNVIERLFVKSDDNEQYSRRNCLRIHGIAEDKNETNDEVVNKIEECYKLVDLPFN